MTTKLALTALAIALLAAPAAAQTAPRYEADRNWPLPFPDRWVTGGYGGLCVDARV